VEDLLEIERAADFLGDVQQHAELIGRAQALRCCFFQSFCHWLSLNSRQRCVTFIRNSTSSRLTRKCNDISRAVFPCNSILFNDAYGTKAAAPTAYASSSSALR